MQRLPVALSILILLCQLSLQSDDLSDDVTVETEQEVEDVPYTSPTPSGSSYLVDNFDDPQKFKRRWVNSQAKKEGLEEDLARYDGVWELESPRKDGLKGDLGLVLKSKAKHAAISAKLERPFVFNEKPLIVQYEVMFQEGQGCGGAYIKLLSQGKDSPDFLRQFTDKTPYTIMFGPDKCGNDIKLHFIFRHKNPNNGSFEEKHCKKPKERLQEVFDDKRPHLYTLIVNPDNTFQIQVDHNTVNEGNLLEDFTPPVNPPAEIDDPNDSKPASWDEREQIPDPDAHKPEDWDEYAPRMIIDPHAKKPEDWLEDQPTVIPDPGAQKPEDWDTDTDGEWEPPLVDNPVCEKVSGCGKWEHPTMDNPEYKGKWRAPLIDNPNYQGKWRPRLIPNPEYFFDRTPFKMTAIGAVGLELWSMSPAILLDNILITDSLAVAEDYASKSFDLKKLKIDQDSESVQTAFLRYSNDRPNDRPYLYGVYILLIGLLPIALIIVYCCGSPKITAEESSEATCTIDLNKTDELTSKDSTCTFDQMKKIDEQTLEVSEVIDRYGTHAKNGLSTTEAEERLQKWGANLFYQQEHFFKKLWEFQLSCKVHWGICAISAITALCKKDTEHSLNFAVTIASLIIGTALHFLQEKQIEKQFVQNLIQNNCEVRVIRNSQLTPIKPEEIVPGDLLNFEKGSIACADCRVVESNELNISRYILTGDPKIEMKDSRIQPDKDFQKAKNIIVSGSLCTGGTGKAVALRTGTHTRFSLNSCKLKCNNGSKTLFYGHLRNTLFILSVPSLVLFFLMIFFCLVTRCDFLPSVIDAFSVSINFIEKGASFAIIFSLTTAAKSLINKCRITSLFVIYKVSKTDYICIGDDEIEELTAELMKCYMQLGIKIVIISKQSKNRSKIIGIAKSLKVKYKPVTDHKFFEFEHTTEPVIIFECTTESQFTPILEILFNKRRIVAIAGQFIENNLEAIQDADFIIVSKNASLGAQLTADVVDLRNKALDSIMHLIVEGRKAYTKMIYLTAAILGFAVGEVAFVLFLRLFQSTEEDNIIFKLYIESLNALIAVVLSTDSGDLIKTQGSPADFIVPIHKSYQKLIEITLLGIAFGIARVKSAGCKYLVSLIFQFVTISVYTSLWKWEISQKFSLKLMAYVVPSVVTGFISPAPISYFVILCYALLYFIEDYKMILEDEGM